MNEMQRTTQKQNARDIAERMLEVLDERETRQLGQKDVDAMTPDQIIASKRRGELREFLAGGDPNPRDAA